MIWSGIVRRFKDCQELTEGFDAGHYLFGSTWQTGAERAER